MSFVLKLRDLHIHKFSRGSLMPAGLRFLLNKLLWVPPTVALFNESAIGALRCAVEIPVTLRWPAANMLSRKAIVFWDC